MIKRIVSWLITKIKKEPYQLDANILSSDICIILWERGRQALRGTWKALFFGRHHGIMFAGRHTKIRHAKHISAKNGLMIGDYCQINALSKGGIQFGDNVSIGSGTIIECTGVIRELGESLKIGNNVGFAQNCFIEMRGNISIGDNCIFASDVSINSENHNYSQRSQLIRRQGATRRGIRIGEDCWVGTKAVILDGVTIGKGCVIAAGAVVNRDVPEYSVVGGVPARILKIRGEENENITGE